MITAGPMTFDDLNELLDGIPDVQTGQWITARFRDCPGRHFCLRADDALIACGGISLYWSGVGCAWLEVTSLATHYPLALCKSLIGATYEIIRDLHLHRVQCEVWAGDARAHRLMRHLGWIAEAYLQAYGPDGRDAYLYRLLTKE